VPPQVLLVIGACDDMDILACLDNHDNAPFGFSAL